MPNKFSIPKHLPAAACGRCYWFLLTGSDGYGVCQNQSKKRVYYKCIACPEYEPDFFYASL